MKGVAVTIAAVMATCAGVANADEKRRDRDERAIRDLEIRARRQSHPAAGDEIGLFLAQETARLTERVRTSKPESYGLRRLVEALDDLLDARDDLTDLHKSDESRRDRHKREDTARRLEQVYFRVQQAEYFAGLSGDPHAPGYVRRSRQLYQQARSAWDRGEYRHAMKLASASSELVNVLENLAQAAVRRPDPPVLR